MALPEQVSGHPGSAEQTTAATPSAQLDGVELSALKLFVWANPYQISYGSSLLFAVAETVEQAREEASMAGAYAFGEYSADGTRGHYAEKLGEPTRVLDLPCAEWHEWSE